MYCLVSKRDAQDVYGIDISGYPSPGNSGYILIPKSVHKTFYNKMTRKCTNIILGERNVQSLDNFVVPEEVEKLGFKILLRMKYISTNDEESAKSSAKSLSTYIQSYIDEAENSINLASKL